MEMLIRPATTADIASLAPLVQSYWEFEAIAGFERARIETLLHTLLTAPQSGACWVAESEGRLCGYLLAVFMFSLEHGGLMAEIDEIFVSREMRSLGVGSLLLASAQGELEQRGLKRLQLQLGSLNDRAAIFYARHGFSRRAGFALLDKPLALPDARER
jgi:GNAT superfamily N-acetyltransferase